MHSQGKQSHGDAKQVAVTTETRRQHPRAGQWKSCVGNPRDDRRAELLECSGGVTPVVCVRVSGCGCVSLNLSLGGVGCVCGGGGSDDGITNMSLSI